MKVIIRLITLIFAFGIIISCTNSERKFVENDSDSISAHNSFQYMDTTNHTFEYPQIGKDAGSDTIIGNFTGHSIDTIFVEEYSYKDNDYQETDYRIVSKNPKLPNIQTFGKPHHVAFIINEGDLDGDGKDELGWMRCSFKGFADEEYHLLKFKDGNWYELVDEEGNIFMFTGTERHSDIDLFAKGNKKGTIIKSSVVWPEEPGDMVERRDTICNPVWIRVKAY